MKKLIILMLSLAVLFSFAACDNSNNNQPADPEQPGNGVSSGLVADVVDNVMRGEFENVTPVPGDFSARIATMLGIDSTNVDIMTARAGYTVNVTDPTALTVTHTIAASVGDTYPAQTETLVVKAIKTGNSTAKTVALDSFEYTYTGYMTDSVAQAIVPVSMTVKGWFGNTACTAAYTTAADGKINSYKLDIASSAFAVVLPESNADVSVTINNETDHAVAFDTLSLNNAALTYATYQTGKESAVKTKVGEYMDLFTAEDVVAAIAGWLKAAPATNWSAEYNPANGGSAKFTFTPAAETKIIGDSKVLNLAANTPITITLTGAASTNPADASFNAATYSIDGVLSAYSAASTAETTFKTIDINVSGSVKASKPATDYILVSKGSTANAVGSVAAQGTVANITLEATSGSAAVTAEVEPMLKATTADDGSVSVALTTGPVTVTYPAN